MGWRHFHRLPRGKGGAWREYTPLEKIPFPCVVKLHPPPSKIAPYVVHPLWILVAWKWFLFKMEVFVVGKLGLLVILCVYTGP